MARFVYIGTRKWSRGGTLRMVIGSALAIWLAGGLVLALAFA